MSTSLSLCQSLSLCFCVHCQVCICVIVFLSICLCIFLRCLPLFLLFSSVLCSTAHSNPLYAYRVQILWVVCACVYVCGVGMCVRNICSYTIAKSSKKHINTLSTQWGFALRVSKSFSFSTLPWIASLTRSSSSVESWTHTSQKGYTQHHLTWAGLINDVVSHYPAREMQHNSMCHI